MAYNKRQQEATDRYTKEHMEQVAIRVPKGERQALQDAANERNLSMRQLIATAVNQLMGRDVMTVTDGQRGRKPRQNVVE